MAVQAGRLRDGRDTPARRANEERRHGGPRAPARWPGARGLALRRERPRPCLAVAGPHGVGAAVGERARMSRSRCAFGSGDVGSLQAGGAPHRIGAPNTKEPR
jgi:hypothetical protein